MRERERERERRRNFCVREKEIEMEDLIVLIRHTQSRKDLFLSLFHSFPLSLSLFLSRHALLVFCPCQVSLFYSLSSVTRFGHFGKVLQVFFQFFLWFIKYWVKIVHLFWQYLFSWAYFPFCKWPNIEK